MLDLAVLNGGKAPDSIDEALALLGMDVATFRRMSKAEVQNWVKDNEVAVGFSDRIEEAADTNR